MDRLPRADSGYATAGALVLLLAVEAACGVKSASRGAGDAKPTATFDTQFHGRIVATNATELRAPQNVFRVGGWRSESNSTHLVELASEGERVRKGTVVARFRFRHKRAKTYVDDRLRKANADAEKVTIDLDRKLQELKAERENRELAAQRARIDTLRGRAISKRQLQLFQIDHRIAAFEQRAVAQRLAAFERSAAAEKQCHREGQSQARADLDRYFRNKARYALVAPHDGIVRHAYHRELRRKIRKGDGLNAGSAVLSIARDDKLSVRFFVPEHRLRELRIGDKVTVQAVGAETEQLASVTKVERFPQEMGFLRQDSSLPNAREKAFAVLATFVGKPSDFTAGTEIQACLTAERR